MPTERSHNISNRCRSLQQYIVYVQQYCAAARYYRLYELVVIGTENIIELSRGGRGAEIQRNTELNITFERIKYGVVK